MNKEGKFVRILDSISETTKIMRYMFIGFMMIIVYVEFVSPSLSWSRWIIDPVFILVIIGLVWEGLRSEIIDEKKKKREVS